MFSQLPKARSNLFPLGSLSFLEGEYTFLHSKARTFFSRSAHEVLRQNVWRLIILLTWHGWMLGTSPAWTGPATVPITPILTGLSIHCLGIFSDDEMQSAISIRPNIEFSLVPKCELWVLGINQIWSSAKCDRLCKRSSPTGRWINLN